MLLPKKVKHRKWQKGRQKGKATSNNQISFGQFALKSLGTHWITARQIEAARRTITRYLQKGGKIWIRIFPDKPVTAKSSEIPMGSGKGAVDHFVAVVKPGTIIFEIDGVKKEMAREALRRASFKLPVKTKFLEKK